MKRRTSVIGKTAKSAKEVTLSTPTPTSVPVTYEKRQLSYLEILLLIFCLSLFCLGCDVRFLPTIREALRPFDTKTVELSTVSDVRLQSGIMLVVYVIQYFVLGGVFELTHPDGILSSSLSPERLALRRKQVTQEILTGIVSLSLTVFLAVTWMWQVEPRLWTYSFFTKHEWTPAWALGGIIAYIASFDTHFYWSHWLLHESTYLWDNVHFYHHQFKEPSAFAQFSVHPLESALQGPMGHFFVQLFFPVHPIQLAIMGFLGSAWAFAAHDGRGFDFNSHFFHHSKGRGRKFYFNLGFLTPFWDNVMGTRWHPNHPLWLEWQAAKNKGKAFDTLDGTSKGWRNDSFDAYNASGPKAQML